MGRGGRWGGGGGGGIALNSCAVAIVQFESLVQQFISTGDVHRP